MLWEKYCNSKYIQKMTTNVGGKSPKIDSKRRFRPKNREEKELRGENGAFDTETARFPTAREVRSARKRPKSGKRPEIFGGSVVCRETRIWNFEGSEIRVAELRSRRFSHRLNRTGETPNFGWVGVAKAPIFPDFSLHTYIQLSN